ncbi:MAG: glycoside hydrolase family 130 protein [Calditrichaeota bacterium]|nr:glycoside hydrolase family 130 protein [Calditrichota bacterium]HQU71879.1 glycoside hydrolase family 130 protein [Calditrichia bacterium]
MSTNATKSPKTGARIVNGTALPNIPWEDKPAGCHQVVWRYSGNPIIGWNPVPAAARIFNSAVIPYQGGFVGIFRADEKNAKPQLYFGTSEDALKWDIRPERIKWVNEAGEAVKNGYAYDPRLLKLGDAYYINWCDDFPGPSIGMGMTRDFKTFVKLENPTFPFNRNGVLFPRQINGLYVLLSRPSDSGHTPFGDIVLSHSPDLVYWGKHRHVMSRGVESWWESTKIGAGPVPIETTEGWLLIYHGVTTTCNGFVYSMGAALLDLDDPSKVLYRTRDYILTPEADYETTGFVPNVAFPCATLADAETGRIAIYYGAADTYTAVAFARVDELIAFVKENSQV